MGLVMWNYSGAGSRFWKSAPPNLEAMTVLPLKAANPGGSVQKAGMSQVESLVAQYRVAE